MPTEAVVPEGLAQYNADAQWIFDGPACVERTFKSNGFPCVSVGYVRELEDGLRLIRELAVKANASKSRRYFTVQNSVLKFCGELDARTDSRGFTVNIMITRPCCMGQGFARLMLYWMARLCYAFGMDMRISMPTSHTQALIKRAFGKVADVSVKRDDYITLPHRCLGGAFNHLDINPAWFVEHDNDADMDFIVPTPPRLNRGSLDMGFPFPHAFELSNGQAYASKRALV
jgi:hypothetical protein